MFVLAKICFHTKIFIKISYRTTCNLSIFKDESFYYSQNNGKFRINFFLLRFLFYFSSFVWFTFVLLLLMCTCSFKRYRIKLLHTLLLLYVYVKEFLVGKKNEIKRNKLERGWIIFIRHSGWF